MAALFACRYANSLATCLVPFCCCVLLVPSAEFLCLLPTVTRCALHPSALASYCCCSCVHQHRPSIPFGNTSLSRALPPDAFRAQQSARTMPAGLPAGSPLSIHCLRLVQALWGCFHCVLLPFCFHTRPYKAWYCTVVLIAEEGEVCPWLVHQQYHKLLHTLNKLWKIQHEQSTQHQDHFSVQFVLALRYVSCFPF